MIVIKALLGIAAVIALVFWTADAQRERYADLTHDLIASILAIGFLGLLLK